MKNAAKSGLNFTVSFEPYSALRNDYLLNIDALVYTWGITLYRRELDLFDVDLRDKNDFIDYVINDINLSFNKCREWRDVNIQVNDYEALQALIEYRVKYWFKNNGIPECLIDGSDDSDHTLVVIVDY